MLFKRGSWFELGLISNVDHLGLMFDVKLNSPDYIERCKWKKKD